jgi:hypothetical protein
MGGILICITCVHFLFHAEDGLAEICLISSDDTDYDFHLKFSWGLYTLSMSLKKYCHLTSQTVNWGISNISLAAVI